MDDKAKKQKSFHSTPTQRVSKTPGRKAYARPSLVEYGSIAKLTQGGASAGSDGGMMQAACL